MQSSFNLNLKQNRGASTSALQSWLCQIIKKRSRVDGCLVIILLVFASEEPVMMPEEVIIASNNY